MTIDDIVRALEARAERYENSIDANQWGNLSASAEQFAAWKMCAEELRRAVDQLKKGLLP